MSNKKIEDYNRKSLFALTNDWDILSSEHDYLEVTEWHNGEGVDVNIYSKEGTQMFSMTFGQYKLFKKMMKQIYN